ncbi:YceI family protein [Psychromicrobium xiongbiense]|uniref:YceI family protein n=1 Tax=Psychromicrobium xiongbiense TaxID=3051184 RepID=UPI0025564649|nr:YceI family protein [Psychromicrobium sp. YIM S02556]
MAIRKRTRLILVVAVVVVLLGAVAVFLGPQWYAASQGPAPAPLSLSSPSTTVGSPTAPGTSAAPSAATTAGVANPADAGQWKVGTGSQAGYRIDEQLNGAKNTVVGRTGKVSGTATVAGGQLTQAQIDVDVASIMTDNGTRDNYFRGSVMKTDSHPTASFVLSAPVGLPGLSATPVSLSASGSLELAGQKHEVVAKLQVARSDAQVSISGTIDLVLADFSIQPPNLGFVKVANTGTIEFLLRLDHLRP